MTALEGSAPGTIYGVLLAAGAGARFGGGKLLHPLDGTPIGVVAWRNLSAALPRSVAVVRAGDAALTQRLAAEGARVLECPDAHAGMGHSLAHAIRNTAGAAGWLIALGDMPRIEPDTIRLLARRLLDGAGIVVPARDGRRGHPVGFAARYGDELTGLSGDRGARGLLERHAAEVQTVDVDDPGILLDVDSVEDLKTVTASASSPSRFRSP